MPFDLQTLSEARSQGYTDDQIYDHLSESDDRFRVAKQNGYSLDDIAAHLTKGGEQTNEDEQKRNQSEASPDRNAGREADQQEQAVGTQEGLQADGMLRSQDQGQRQRDDQADLKGGEVESERQTQDAQGGLLQRQEAGQRLEGQVPARNQEEVAGDGVRSSSLSDYFSRLTQKATEKPGQAALAGGEELVGSAIDLAIGGSVAAGVSALAEAGTFGVATPIVPAIAMAGMAGGTWASRKVRKAIEKAIGFEEEVQKAQEAQPEITEAAGLAAMAPMISRSIPRLVEMGLKKGAQQAAIGAAGGVAFEPIRYGVESVATKLTGSEEEVAPVTGESLLQSAALSALMSGHAAKRSKGETEISDAGLPETAKIAGEVKTDAAIEATQKVMELAPDPNERAEVFYKLSEEFADKGEVEKSRLALEKAQAAHAGETDVSDWLKAQRETKAQTIEEKISTKEPSIEEPAKVETEAQPTKPSEEQIKETSGVSPVEGKPVVGEAEGKTEEGIAPREGEGAEEVEPTGNRIGAAAWKNPRTGFVSYGKNHEEAVANAARLAEDPSNKDKVVTADLPKQDITKPENRETKDFGFVTNEGDFVSREEGQGIAEKTGQFLGKKTDRPVMHSNEVQLDFYEKPKARAEAKPQQLAGAAAKSEFTESRISEAVRAINDVENLRNRLVDVNNEGDKRAWQAEINKRFDLGTFSKEELDSLWNQSHEAYRIRKASGDTIPIEKAVQQVGGDRIQSQRRIATNNELINNLLVSKGKAPLLPGREITQTHTWQVAASKMAEDPQWISGVIADLKKTNRIATPEEVVGIEQHMGELQNKLDQISEERNAEKDETKLAGIDARHDKVLQDIADVAQAYRNTGTEASASLRLRAIHAAADFSLPRVIAKLEKAAKRKLTKDELKDVEKLTSEEKSKTEELEKKRQEAKAKREDDDIKKATQSAEGSARRASSERRAGKKASELSADEQIAKHTSELKYREDNARGLGDSIRKIATAIARKKIESEIQRTGLDPKDWPKGRLEEITKTRDITEETNKIVSREIGDGWNIKNTRDAISGYGIFSNPPKSFLSKVISRARGENLQIGKIEDIVSGKAPKRTGPQREKPSAEERTKAQLVNKLARRFNIVAEDPEKQLQGSLQSAKTRAKNLIEELENIAAKGRPLTEEVRSEIYKEDPELNDLKGEILGLKQLVEDTYGKREIPIERKVKALERVYDRLIERYQKEVASGEVFKTTTKGEKLTSERLEQQREILKGLQEERKFIRDSDSLRQEGIKYEKNSKRIEQIQKILSGEIPDEKTGKKITEGPETERVAKQKELLSELEGKLKELRDSRKVKKTEAEKQISEYQSKLKSAEERLARVQNDQKKAPPAKKPALTKEAADIKAEIDEINKQVKEYTEANRKVKTEEEKRESLLERQIKNQKDILAKGEIPSKSPRDKATNDRIQALEKELESLKNDTITSDWYKARKEALALQAYKNRNQRMMEESLTRLATGDFSKPEVRETKLDDEARELVRERQKLRDKIQQRITLAEWENRTKLEKALDVTQKIKRAAVLSYLSTIGKLGASSLEIPILRIPSYAVGKALEKTPFFKEIAQRGRQEYGTALSEDMRQYANGFFSGIGEFKNIAFKLGRSQLDLEYGDGSLIPLGALDLPGKIHEAIKNPTKLANYKMAYARYLQWAARQGMDIKSEAVKDAAGVEAYKEANSSIFLKDNGLVQKYNLLITTMKNSDSPYQKVAARILEFNLPIVRIPANIVKEALEYQFGLIPGLTKAMKLKMSNEVGNRVEDLTPEQADTIMRQIKKGSVGALALAIGAAFPDVFGGFYRKGVDQDEEGPEFGGIKIAGVKIPKTVLHHPAFVPFQIGATIAKNMEERFDRETFGDDAGAIAQGAGMAVMGLAEELPFIGFSRNVGKYVDPERLTDTGGELARSMIPGVIQETAKALDVPEHSVGQTLKTLFWSKEDVTKRKAEDFLDHIKEGLPYFREQVPEK